MFASTWAKIHLVMALSVDRVEEEAAYTLQSQRLVEENAWFLRKQETKESFLSVWRVKYRRGAVAAGKFREKIQQYETRPVQRVHGLRSSAWKIMTPWVRIKAFI